jgi:PhnB protein
MKTADSSCTWVREGFHSITPYLISAGVPRLIDFMKEAFGAEEIFRMPLPDGSIMHAEVRIGDSMIELSDGNEQHPPSPTGLHIYVADANAVYDRAVAAGATSLYKPVEHSYGDLDGGITDPSGNHWYIATHKQDPGRYRPEGLCDVTLYLHTRGARNFIDFTQQAFGAEEVLAVPNPDGTLAHAKVRIGDAILELGDAHDQWQPMPASIHLYVPDSDAVYARAIDAGGTSILPVTEQSYGERSGGVRDPWGNRWWIATRTAPPAN